MDYIDAILLLLLQIEVFPSATQGDIDSLFEAFQLVDPDITAKLKLNGITKAALRPIQGWQEFLTLHCHVSPYTLQVRQAPCWEALFLKTRWVWRASIGERMSGRG